MTAGPAGDTTNPTTVAPYEVDGPIALGRTTLIEASAGTGKTYALTAICVRLVAEQGIPIERILLVTFTRAATAELRERVRSRLVEAHRHLSESVDPAESDDPVLTALTRSSDASPCSPEEIDQRRARLSRAVSDFDAATISTIHGFCSQVRASIGVLAEQSTDSVPTQSETDLITQVCADLFFSALSQHDFNPFGNRSLDNIVDLVQKARTLTGVEIQAGSGLPSDLATVDLVNRAVDEVELRLRRQGGQSFDSLLVGVRDALRNDTRLVSALRDQFPVALIDEFQDTDPVQWEIFETVFAAGLTEAGTLPRALFLVGDPKQAIYSFRGGDIYTYLEAKKTADVRALVTNQRSDAPVLDAMNRLAADHRYGDADIAYQQVFPSPRHDHRRAVDVRTARPLPGLVIRTLELSPKSGIEKTAGSSRRAIAADLASVVIDLLNHVEVANEAEGPSTPGPVRPSDIAVLVASTAHARPVTDALRAAGVPVVLRLRDDVADSDARHHWRTLLHALDRPASTSRAAAAAITWFFGWEPEEVVAAVEATDEHDAARRRLVQLQQTLAEWADVLTAEGIASVYGRARHHQNLTARLLATETGERNLTDLEHLAELIHAEARSGGRDLTAGTAIEILDSLGGTPDDQVAADAAQRRIDSDSDSVVVMTIHAAKGLEFPFVLLPYLYDGGARVSSSRPFVFYDHDREHRVIDISAPTDPETGEKRDKKLPDAETKARTEAQLQACGDQHRLTYVALTRSMHQTVLWWSNHGSVKKSGVTRMLLGSPDIPASTDVKVPTAGYRDAIADRVAESGATASVSVTDLDPDTPVDPTTLEDPPSPALVCTDPEGLRTAELGRKLDRLRRVWSFSSISRDLHTALPDHLGGDPTLEAGDDIKAQDEPPGQTSADTGSGATSFPTPDSRGDWTQPDPFAGLGGGKDFGNLIHHVFEFVDFTDPDLDGAVAEILRRPLGYRVSTEQHARLPGVLAEVIRTPLGTPFADLRLADLAPRDRLNELTFHFGLAPVQAVSAGRIGAVVADHLDPDDPLHRWAQGLERGLAGTQLQGFLNGSIDLTLRQTVDGNPRFSVIDYKTNNLASDHADPTLHSYRPARLTRAMADNQYALQALIYSVALHRYLRWRLPNYDPALHLGPVGYLFVRGMVGDPTPSLIEDGRATRAGVFTWQVPPAVVAELSELFAGPSTLGDRV
ncbi:MAG: UvrD-helicase domain-containing protein [Acidimicrobiales bacterium]|nr:UvrD-helicase domain-containing protein [Acidimicrobiales bacterium]